MESENYKDFYSFFPSFRVSDLSTDVIWRRLLDGDAGAAEVADGAAGAGARGLDEPRWVHIDAQGRATLISVDRHLLVHQLKLRYRDLSAIDPTLPLVSPSVVLVRARAIALNLDVGSSLRMIIAENQVYVLSVPAATDPATTAVPTLDHPLVRRLCTCLAPSPASRRDLTSPGSGRTGPESSYIDVEGMPFELRALEIALAAAVGILALDVSALEEWARPTVEALLAGVSREALEGVRLFKNAIDRVQNKTQRIVTEINDLLEDDEDMADLYLARRAEAQGLAPLRQPWEEAEGDDSSDVQGVVVGSEEGSSGGDESAGERRRRHQRHRQRELRRRETDIMQDSRRHSGHSGRSGHASSASLASSIASSVDSEAASEALEDAEEHLMRQGSLGASWTATGAAAGGVPAHYLLEEAEDLLETMFERADFLQRRLCLLDEKVHDAEALLDLDLDQKRNQLVGLTLVVSTVSMSFGFAAMLGGVFGMNLKNSELASTGWVLLLVLLVMVVGSVALLAVVVWYVRKKRLMFIPTTL
jgi:hypothetical protein